MLSYIILIFMILTLLALYYYLKFNIPVSSSRIETPWIEQSISPSKSIRIITPEGSKGTDLDASLYSSILGGCEIIFANRDHPETHPLASKYYDINIYVEEYLGKGKCFPCKTKYLMVNQEMLQLDKLEDIDIFICKSKYSTDLVENYIREKGLKGRVLETKHSSEDVQLLTNEDSEQPKDYNLFVHFAGKSWLKNTETIIQAWIDAKGFPELGSPTLMITCRNMCYYFNLNIIVLLAAQFYKTKIDDTEVYIHKLYKNIRIYESMPLDIYNHYRMKAGFYICPSYVEGYGHYINEGRSAGAVVITIDAPPMNELSHLVTIPYVQKERFGQLPGSYAFLINASDVIDIVRRVKRIDEPTLKKMGQEERLRFIDDTRSLEHTLIKEFIDKN